MAKHQSPSEFTGDPSDVLAAIMAEWGGVAEWVRELRQDAKALPAGHANRIKIHLGILQAHLKFGSPPEEKGSLKEKKAKLAKLIEEELASEDHDLLNDEEDGEK